MLARKIDINKLEEMLKQGIPKMKIAEHFKVTPAAITKACKRLIPVPESFANLTDKQKKFALSIAQGKTATQAALDAYECSSRKSAKVLGSNLMADPDMRAAIADILAEEGLTKRYRVQRLKQCVDHKDPIVCLKGLDMSFKLDGSYAPEKQIGLIASLPEISERRRKLEAEIAELEALIAIEEAEFGI